MNSEIILANGEARILISFFMSVLRNNCSSIICLSGWNDYRCIADIFNVWLARSDRAIQKWFARNIQARTVHVSLQLEHVGARTRVFLFFFFLAIKIENYVGQTQRHLRESTYWIDECHIQACLCMRLILKRMLVA